MWVKLQSQRAFLCSPVWSPQAAARRRMWPRVGQYQGGEEQFSRCPGQETLGALHRPHYPLAATHHYSAERCPAAQWHQCGMYTKPESTSRQQLAASNILCRTRNSRKSSWGFVSLSLFLNIFCRFTSTQITCSSKQAFPVTKYLTWPLAPAPVNASRL